jgi:acid stress-induced BolA-like protein IbaG/YrbA
MAIQIGRSPSELAGEMRSAIEAAIPGATVEVLANGAGHFSVRVVAAAFAGKGRVAQQQMVYGALAPFMRGDGAPVHAIDELRTETA